MSLINETMKEYLIYKKQDQEVKIIENFFSEEILNKIIDYFKNIHWKCQCNKDPNVSNNSGDSPYWRIELKDETFFNSYLKNIIESWYGKELELNRIYVVGQTFGQDSLFHIDDETKNTFTFCFYINKQDEVNEDGFFYLKLPNEKYIITIEPYMNSMIIFPSTFRHKGCGFGKDNNNLRICIAWKFKIKNI